jgi:hypothetical protein
MCRHLQLVWLDLLIPLIGILETEMPLDKRPNMIEGLRNSVLHKYITEI